MDNRPANQKIVDFASYGNAEKKCYCLADFWQRTTGAILACALALVQYESFQWPLAEPLLYMWPHFSATLFGSPVFQLL